MSIVSPRCRIGLVQIATLPAYTTLDVDWLREPAPPVEDRSYLAGIKNKPGLQNLRHATFEAHLSDLLAKVRMVLQAATEYRIDLLVFPEYSLPPEALREIHRWAKENTSTVIAGSHVVVTNPDALKEYASCGLEAIQRSPNTFVRKAIAPIFLADGQVDYRLKAVRSKWEADLITDEGLQSPLKIIVQGQEIKLQVLLCIDALSLGMVDPGANLLAICALSPQIEPFQNLFNQTLLNEIPSVIANSAIYGGTQFALTGPSARSDYAKLLEVDEPEEVFLIADVELGRQFQKRRSVDSEPSWKPVARKPFLYRAVSSHARLSDHLQGVRANPRTISSIPFEEFIGDPGLPTAIRTQLEAFFDASKSGAATESDALLLLDALVLDESVLPFWNRCQQTLEEANRQISTILPDFAGDSGLAESLLAISRGMRHSKKRLLPLTVLPTPLREASTPQSSRLFVDRENDTSRVSSLLRKSTAVLLVGLPGIGKSTLAQQVTQEMFPRYNSTTVHCVDGMTPTQLVKRLEAVLPSSDYLSRLDAASKSRECHVVLVRDFDLVEFGGPDLPEIARYCELLKGTEIRLIFMASRRIDELDIPTWSLGALGQDDTRRIFDFYCRLRGVAAVDSDELVTHLWGYPLAARTAATVLAAGRGESFTKLRFLRRLRSEVAKVLLRGISLSPEETKAIEALSIFRRPVDRELAETLGIEGSIDELEKKFIVSQEEGKVFIVPLIREVAIEDWIRPGAAKGYHRAAAKYFKDAIASSDKVRSFEAADEAIYHFISIGDLTTAKALGGDWLARARSASRDLYKRGGYKESAVICEKALEANPQDKECLVRLVLCSARTKKWPKGRECIERLRVLGPPPANALTAYGEALSRAGFPLEGKEYLEECLREHPQDAYAYAVLAAIHLDTGDLRVAKNLADEALENDRACVRALDVASTIARREGNYERAYQLAYQLMSLDPKRGEKTFQKARSALTRKFDGPVPPELLAELER